MTRYLLRTFAEFIILAAFAVALLAGVAYMEGIIQ